MTATTWHAGGWMQTYTGRQFYPLDPYHGDIDQRDIAHALSLICRYGGHVDHFYSVAEHCVLLSHAVSPENALWALLHDATEAYGGRHHPRPTEGHAVTYTLTLAGWEATGGIPDEVYAAGWDAEVAG